MLRIALALAVLLTVAEAHAAQTYTVDNWPADVDTIPCSAWDHLSDGTWVLRGSVKLGASVVENVGFKGDSSARLLDKKCGKR